MALGRDELQSQFSLRVRLQVVVGAHHLRRGANDGEVILDAKTVAIGGPTERCFVQRLHSKRKGEGQ